MSHAGLPLSQADGLREACQSEYEVLSGPTFDRMVDRGITLWPMNRFLARGDQ